MEFQNPFAEPVEFSLQAPKGCSQWRQQRSETARQVDNPSFQLTQRAVKLDSKKTAFALACAAAAVQCACSCPVLR